MASKTPQIIDLKIKPVPSVPSLHEAPLRAVRNEWEAVVAENDRQASSLRTPIVLGVSTLALGLGGFLLWSTTTSIAAASIATGQVIVDGQVKKVTPYEGGVLDKLLVSEGDRVKTGQVLATLDTTRTTAELSQLEHQAVGLEVKKERLIAERDGLSSFQYFPEKTGRFLDSGVIKNVLDVEKKFFHERKKYLQESISIEKSLVDQLESQRQALEARLASYQEQIALVEVDKKSLEKLFQKKLTTKTELSAKQISYMEIQSKILETEAALIEVSQKNSQAKISIMNRETEFNRDVVQSLQETQIEILLTGQKIISARDIVEKAKIKSPQDGIIANIDENSRTRGSAVIAGKAVLEVVPTNKKLIIDGKLPTRNINDARVGAKVEVKIVNTAADKLDPVFGTLIYVGADSITDERTGDSYFPIHVEIPISELQRQKDMFLAPGVLAELFIINGERTAISYLLQPIRDSFSRAFREN